MSKSRMFVPPYQHKITKNGAKTNFTKWITTPQSPIADIVDEGYGHFRIHEEQVVVDPRG